jgi:hypothetical protein
LHKIQDAKVEKWPPPGEKVKITIVTANAIQSVRRSVGLLWVYMVPTGQSPFPHNFQISRKRTKCGKNEMRKSNEVMFGERKWQRGLKSIRF